MKDEINAPYERSHYFTKKFDKRNILNITFQIIEILLV